MKSTVEKLSPTRVRISVEVPFTELQPDFDRAYKELAKQVRLPGFRPGKAPASFWKLGWAGERCWSRSSTGSSKPLLRGGDDNELASARPAGDRGHQD